MPYSTTRKWLVVASTGYALILLALLLVGVALLAKKQFGPPFLGSVGVLVLAGSVALESAMAALPFPRTWRTWAVILWGFIAMTSPLFGVMFLLPWGFLLLTAPIICSVLLTWFRAR